jgi:polysaccharide export outer membrane protein
MGAMKALRREWLALGVLAALAAGSAACAGRAISPPPADPTPEEREYRIGVTDVVRISVWRNQELSIDIPVRNDGKISVPLLDDVQAEGLTPTELKEVLTKALSEYITAPDVTVMVLQMNSRFVSVLGGVPAEGRVPLTRDLRVLEAIAVVGGFSTFAQKSDVRVIRRAPDGSESEFRFDYDAYVKGKAPGTNIVLRNGDTIIVPE